MDGQPRQWGCDLAAVVCLCTGVLQPAAAGSVVDDFSRSRLDTRLWSTCESDPSLIGFGTEVATGRNYVIIRIDGKRVDIDPHLPHDRVKFKIGHYRDKIPVKAEMLLDDVCVSGDTAACDVSVTPRP